MYYDLENVMVDIVKLKIADYRSMRHYKRGRISGINFNIWELFLEN